MRIKTLLLFLCVAGLMACSSTQHSLKDEYTIVSYNVENLYDTEDDPTIPDEEFLPSSEKKWDNEKYQKKLADISKVISEINQKELPEVVGLVEIENQKVLVDLISTGALKGKYGIIHEDSPDYRGIDVALIYRKDAFQELMHEVLPVTFPDDPEFKTRDILHVTGKMRNKIVHLFVNHWPSRIGGDEKTEPKRVLAASVLRKKVDEIFSSDADASIIIMGDMNDEPVNKSLKETLGASDVTSNSKLVNLMLPDDNAGKGTYFYSGNWNMLDNIVVSRSVLKGRGIYAEGAKGNIHSSEWMIFKNNSGDKTPNRSYVGNKYVGGVSDHFPVYFKLVVR